MKGTTRQALSSVIPFYNIFEDHLVPILNRQKGQILGKRQDKTVVDRSEINESFSNIKAELGGTFNPFKYALNLLKAVFGSSSEERLQIDLNQLTEYSGLYDNYKFVNEVLPTLQTLLNKQISKEEGLLSKLGFRTNKKVLENKKIQSLKSTFKSWLQPYEQMLSGGIKDAKLYPQDITFLQKLYDHFARNPYAQDLAQDLNRVLGKIQKVQQDALVQKQKQVTQASTSRNLGKSLASMAS